MPQHPGCEKTYQVGSLFRTRCLTGLGSICWPALAPWSTKAMDELCEAFLAHPDLGNRSFLQKLEDQLRSVSDDALRIAVDVLAFYLLYPVKFTASAKVELLKTVLGWRQWKEPADLTLATQAYDEGGIGYPGIFYNTGRPDIFAYLLQLGKLALADPVAVDESGGLATLAERALSVVDRNVGMARNVALHLMLPDEFERVAVDSHKQAIASHFARFVDPADTIDEQLSQIRKALVEERQRPNLDFYDDEIQAEWRSNVAPNGSGDDDPPTPSGKVWVEKTIVAGRSDREAGEYALGQALWSPQKAKGGSDMYRFMRDVRPGDIVLHLTDNRAFTGVSIAESAVQEFDPVGGTAWSGRPGYVIRLNGFRRLKPALDRDVFLAPPYREQLLDLLSSGLRNTFYAKDGNLNQGAYLTPLPPQVLSILNDAYRKLAGRDLLQEVAEPQPSSPEVTPRLDLKAIVDSFRQALAASNIKFGSRHTDIVRTLVASLAAKRFVILTGLSGSGKTQLAYRFGEWLGPDRFRLIPVRPDWTGPEQLLGYEDALLRVEGDRPGWHVPEALEFMLRAAADPSWPYLLILDEMNLAHVERYFADVLSGMESDAPCVPNLRRDTDGRWRRIERTPDKLRFPANLFLIGTVNVDETTYAFSPKVLDRANTLEFRVGSSDFDLEARRPVMCEPGPADLVRGFLEISRDSEWHLTHPAKELDAFRDHLLKVHALLSEGRFEFGHRVFFEAVRFASMIEAAGAPDWRDALDLQILQKILPRLHGSRRNLEPTLAALERFSQNLSDGPEAFTETDGPPRLPRSHARIARFMSILGANQFASFSD